MKGLIKSASKIDLNESSSSITLRIAMKLVSTLPSDAPQATNEILRFVLSNEKLPRDISSIYEDFIPLGTWNQPALPRDWPYLPLVESYTRHKDEIKWNKVDTMRILVLLSLKLVMPELFDELPPTLRFTRMILIYLCDTVSFNENVSALLRKVIPRFLGMFYKYLDLESHVS